MLPLIPIALQLLPELAKWLGGDKAEDVAQKAVAVVSAVTGTSDPAEAMAAISNPAMASQVRVQLAQIAADMEKAERQADLDTLQAKLKDTSDARAQTVALANAKSPIAWAPVVVSAIVLLTFGGILLLALTHGFPPGSEQIATLMLGTLSAMASGVVGYWVGSSSDSSAKTNLIYHSTPVIPVAAPTGWAAVTSKLPK